MSPLDIAQQRILLPAQLELGQVEQALGGLLGGSVDVADLYFQHTFSENWFLEDGLVKSGGYNIEQGVGARAISGEKTVFAYSDDWCFPALSESVKAARAIATGGHNGAVAIQGRAAPVARYNDVDPLSTLSTEQKIQLLQRADQAARAEDSRVEQVVAQLVAAYETILVVSNNGEMSADIRPLVRMNVSVIMAQGAHREQASFGGGGRLGFEHFTGEHSPEAYAREAVRQGSVKLSAEAAPAGEMTVVLGPGWPGVLLHEAVGHGLEGDFNRKGSSTYSGRVGEQVASKGVTIVDDGTLADRRGSLSIDDEGQPSQCTTLIEDGKLVQYMQDRHNAKLMGVNPTGNGRRESFAHLPMPRMTNTYMLPGKDEPADILSSVKNGLYAVNFEGGQVDITSGNFVFSASEAYLIENGKVTRPVKGATLVGNGPQVLSQVSMIGNDLALDSGIGFCGKAGQTVPVGVGQPTLKLDAITVGGTQV